MNDLIHCECGLTYVSGPDDELHLEHHSKYLNGPTIPVLAQLQSGQTIDEYPLFVIDRSIPLSFRKELVRVAHDAQGSMQEFTSGYDGTIDDTEQTMLVLTHGMHAITMVLTALESPFWRLEWSAEGRLVLIEQTPSSSPRHTVSRIWVAKAYRRRGLATMMVKGAAQHLQIGIEDLGWELPLTNDGAKLLRNLLPGKWLGRGDGFALRETIQRYGQSPAGYA